MNKYTDQSDSEKIETLESIIYDMLEGHNLHDIESTGLSEERCEEIYNLKGDIINAYNKRHR